MTKSLETEKNYNNFIIFLFIALAIFMNQSSVIFGVNFSVSDVIITVTLVLLVFYKRLILPIVPTLYFILLSIVVLLTATFYVPLTFNFSSSHESIIVNYIKVLIMFFYFFVGYNIGSSKVIMNILKWYSLTAVIIGTIGIILTLLNVNLLSNILFLGSSRYKGFMNDPNFFAIIQVSALVYFTRVKTTKSLIYKISVFLIIISILVSGSKTGFIALIAYGLIRFIEYNFIIKRNFYKIFRNFLFILVITLSIYIFYNTFLNIFDHLKVWFPSFSRIELLLTNFEDSVSGDGSGRDSAWKVAVEIIKISPLIGIGVGTYIGISKEMFNANVIAHNTYLQLSTEWGIILALLFFLFLLYLISKATFIRSNHTGINLILRDILVVFLIGSLAISLNNARMLWFFMGILLFTTSKDILLKKNPIESNIKKV